MAFSNPFDDPQGAFTFCAMRRGNSVCGRNNAPSGRLGRCVSAAVTGVLPAVAEAHWRTLTPANFTQLQEAQWPAFTFGRRTARHLDGRKTVDLPSAWSVAHYVELIGEVDAHYWPARWLPD